MDSKEIKGNTFVIQGGRCPAKEIYGKPRHYIDRNETTQKKHEKKWLQNRNPGYRIFS